MSETIIQTTVLEPAAQAFVEATANPPYLFDLGPVEGRKAVDEVQSGEIAKPDVDRGVDHHPAAARPARSPSGSCARRARPDRFP